MQTFLEYATYALGAYLLFIAAPYWVWRLLNPRPVVQHVQTLTPRPVRSWLRDFPGVEVVTTGPIGSDGLVPVEVQSTRDQSPDEPPVGAILNIRPDRIYQF